MPAGFSVFFYASLSPPSFPPFFLVVVFSFVSPLCPLKSSARHPARTPAGNNVCRTVRLSRRVNLFLTCICQIVFALLLGQAMPLL